MKKLFSFALFLPLAACAGLDVHGARLGAGVMSVRADDGFVKTDGDGRMARVELTNRSFVPEDVQIGLELGASRSEIADVTLDSLDLGMVVRRYVDWGTLQPYVSARVGYRAAQGTVDIPELGRMEELSHMGYVGGSLGLEARLGGGMSLFVEGGYEGAIGEDFSTHGPFGLIGVSVQF